MDDDHISDDHDLDIQRFVEQYCTVAPGDARLQVTSEEKYDIESFVDQQCKVAPGETRLKISTSGVVIENVDDEETYDQSNLGLASDYKHLSKAQCNSGTGQHHNECDTDCGCKSHSSLSTPATTDEAKATAEADHAWKTLCDSFSIPYSDNSYGLTGADRLSLAEHMLIVPAARALTDQEHAKKQQEQGKPHRKRRKSKNTPFVIDPKNKKVKFVNGLDGLMRELDDCSNGCFHAVDLTHFAWKALIMERAGQTLNMDPADRQEFFKKQITDNICFAGVYKNRGKGRFRFGAIDICPRCFYKCHGIARPTYYRYVKAVREGLRGVDDNKTRDRRRKVMMNFEKAMDEFFKLNGEVYPQHQTVNLPLTTKKAIFHEIKDTLVRDQALEPDEGAYTTFIKIWNAKFTHVVIPYNPRMGKCKHCVQFQEAIERTTNPAEKQRLRDLRRLHYDHITRERQVYWDIRRTAAKSNSKHNSGICDGMDVNKTGLPSFRIRSKIEREYEPFTQKVTGGLMQGMDISHFLFVTGANIPSDTNLNIHVLSRMIQVNKKQLKKTWYIQLDNTAAGNKTVKLMAFLGMLVQYGVFDEVRMFHIIITLQFDIYYNNAIDYRQFPACWSYA